MERRRDDLPGGRFHPVRRRPAGVRRRDSRRRRRTGPGRPRRDAPGFPDHRPRVRRPAGADAATRQELANLLPTDAKTIPLDQLGTSFALSDTVAAQIAARRAAGAGPRILFTTTPTILVPVDGDPVLKPMAGLNVERVVNTRALIVKTGGQFYLTAMNLWYQAPAIEGPWAVTNNPPPVARKGRASRRRRQRGGTDAAPARRRAAQATARSPRQHRSHRTDRDRRPRAIGPRRGHQPASGQEHQRRPFPGPEDQPVLRFAACPPGPGAEKSNLWFASKSLYGPWAPVAPEDRRRTLPRCPRRL